MQLKTIEKIIRKKITDWTATITDESLRERAYNSALVSGGSICSLLLGEDVNDFDVYLKDRSVAKDLASYYTKGIKTLAVWDGRHKDMYIRDFYGSDTAKMKEDTNHFSVALRNLKPDQIKIFVTDGGGGYRVPELDKLEPEGGATKKYTPSYFSPNAISLTDDLQIVIRFHGEASDIHKTFDFVHATNYWTAKDGLVTRKQALESIITRTLMYQGSLYPLTSIIRSKKFVTRKWSIGAGEMLKMIYQTSQLNLDDFDVLEEQLIGVDVAYFSLLIDILRKKRESDTSFELDSEFLCDLIDRVFSGEDMSSM